MQPSSIHLAPVSVRRPPLSLRGDVIAAALALVTFLVFLRALDGGFITFDDPYYVTKNEHVIKGLTLDGIRWAFTTDSPWYWHPLTWLSLQLDATLWWPNPRGFLLTNVLLHAANAALLFLALRSLTGAHWRSAAVALLFAVHPLRVESVAWVTERKDVLSAFFGMLTLWAYAVHAKRPSARSYLAVASAFALSLMAKPMLVTLPFILLMVDWWPLGRWHPGRWLERGNWRLVLEKLPLLAMAVAVCFVTVATHRSKAVMRGLEGLTLAGRVENATVSYVIYLSKMVWPFDLAIFYPHPLLAYNNVDHLPAWKVAGAASLLIAATGAAVALRKTAPYVLVGWVWYVAALLPVIGLVQSGRQAYADRFTYFPQIGILVSVCWAAADLAGQRARLAIGVVATAAGVLALVSGHELSFWHDSQTVWKHAISTTGPNPVALENLAATVKGADAIAYYKDALRIDQKNLDAHVNLGNIYLRSGLLDDAAREQEAALRLDPNLYTIYCNIGVIEAKRGNFALAARRFREAIALKADAFDLHLDLGNALFSLGQIAEAEQEMREAVRLAPDVAAAHVEFGRLLHRVKKYDEAAREEEEAVRLEPKSYEAYYQLARIETERGDLARAVQCYQTALELRQDFPQAQNGLGLALFRQGHVQQALAVLSEAVRRHPQDAVAHLNLGRILEAQGDLENAARQLDGATRHNPGLAEAWYDLGRVRTRQGQLAGAVTCFEQAVSRDPSSEPYRKALEAARQSHDRAGAGGSGTAPR
jgi:protein O-mannosyl-transferase